MKSKIFKTLLSFSLVMLSVTDFNHCNKHGEPANPLFSDLDTKVVIHFKDALKDRDVEVANSLPVKMHLSMSFEKLRGDHFNTFQDTYLQI